MAYTLTQKEYIRLKSKLTRAVNTGSYVPVRDACREAHAIFEEKGYPDDWSRWQRAYDDASAYADRMGLVTQPNPFT